MKSYCLQSGFAYAAAFVFILNSVSQYAAAQDDTEKQQQEKFAKFEKLLSGSKLVGSFTVVGAESKELQEEEYTIEKVTKLDEGDSWLFKARIKYGKYDFTVPLKLDVQWADDTPMVTLTDFEIPGFGTFSSRVLFYNGKYAGTWSHGDHGGHMFGKIVTAEMQKEMAEKEGAESSQEDQQNDGQKSTDKNKSEQ